MYQGLGTAWLATSSWFGVQGILAALSGKSIVFRLLSLPAMYAGDSALVSLFAGLLLGGIVLTLWGRTKQQGNLGRPFVRFFLVICSLTAFALLYAFGFSGALSENTVDLSKVPTTEQVFSYVADVYNMGVRRAGSAAAHKTEGYLKTKLARLGIPDVRVDSMRFDYWEANAWSVAIGDSAKPIESFYMPYSHPTGKKGQTAELTYVETGNEEDFAKKSVKGKIVLVDLKAVDVSWDKMKLFAYMAYDPRQTTKGLTHPYPVGWVKKFEKIYERAVEQGAVGVVGILSGYPDMGKFSYYAPYDAILRPLPAFYIRESDGKRLINALASKPQKAHLTLDATVSRQGRSGSVVYGVLKGRSSKCLLIHSHYDSPFQSGVEDASGVGMVLGLAGYYAQLPPEKRDYTLIFWLPGMHMAGQKINYEFAKKYQEGIMRDVLFDVSIEHIADDYNPPQGKSGYPEPRALFTTENPVTLSILARLIDRHKLHRTLVLPTVTPLGVPNDAFPLFKEGYPIVSMLSGPSWLLDDDDTLERVAKQELVPLTRFYIDLIQNIGHRDAYTLLFNLNVAASLWLMFIVSPLILLVYQRVQKKVD